MSKKKMPKVLYVRMDEDDIFIAEPTLDGVVEEKGDTIVGVYTLTATPRKFRKVVSKA